jgi:hypothetical protein
MPGGSVEDFAQIQATQCFTAIRHHQLPFLGLLDEG